MTILVTYSTGNPIVDKVSQINVTGNVTSITWYKTLLSPGGKPYLIAIIILSDIVCWYRAKETRDEETGMVLEALQRYPTVREAYDKWIAYEKSIRGFYTEDEGFEIPLVDNKEFGSIKMYFKHYLVVSCC